MCEYLSVWLHYLILLPKLESLSSVLIILQNTPFFFISLSDQVLEYSCQCVFCCPIFH